MIVCVYECMYVQEHINSLVVLYCSVLVVLCSIVLMLVVLCCAFCIFLYLHFCFPIPSHRSRNGYQTYMPATLPCSFCLKTTPYLPRQPSPRFRRTMNRPGVVAAAVEGGSRRNRRTTAAKQQPVGCRIFRLRAAARLATVSVTLVPVPASSTAARVM